jgi:glutaredoxin
VKVELVTRLQCGLCEEAARALRTLGINFVEADVDQDPTLFERYNEAVPVLLVDGREVARAPMNLEGLRRAWRDISASAAPGR